MSHLRRGLAAVALFSATAAIALAADVVVLKGGSVIQLKQPWVRRGETAYLTRSDGTMFSVPVAEIDRDATAAARTAAAAPAPPPAAAPAASTPAGAVRGNRDVPKAKVKITDSDVSHPMELPEPAPGEAKKELQSGAAKVEIAEYNQQKEGTFLIVTGRLRNPTQQAADNVKLSVSAIDEKGQTIDSGAASLAKGIVESGMTVDFTAKINVGDKIVSTLRFTPTWTGPKPTPAAPVSRGSSNANPRPAGR